MYNVHVPNGFDKSEQRTDKSMMPFTLDKQFIPRAVCMYNAA